MEKIANFNVQKKTFLKLFNMQNFEFLNPVNIIFGKDQLQKLPNLLPEKARILLLYGGGSILKNGVHKQVTNYLKGFHVVEFSGIEPNPHYETCLEAVKAINANKLDFILAVGGGSVIDAAKFIAAAALYTDGEPWGIMTKGKPVTQALSIGAILTLPATGSEMNSGAVITNITLNDKLAFSSKVTFPKFSFLLPDAAGTLPKKQVANGIVDAFVHVIEQYLTYPSNAPLQDRMAESVLQSLIEVAPAVFANPADYEAMSNLMWSATMALNGLIGCGQNQDWSIHMIGHELTALHGIDHARTLAIVLPGLWKVTKEAKKEKLLQYGARVWNITQGTDEEKLNATIAKTEAFFQSVNIDTKLSRYNVPRETINLVAERIEKRGWTKLGDRGMVTPQVIREILETQYQ